MSSGSSKPTQYPPGFLEQDYGPRLIAATVILIVFETLVLVLRLICRSTTKVVWGRDDVFILLGYVACLGLNLMCAISVSYAGVGLHIAKNMMIDPARLTHELRSLFIDEWFYGLACFFCKMAILELYVRIFPTKKFRWLCYGTMAVVTASMIQILAVATFQCTPVAFAWDKSLHGHCIDTQSFYRWTSFPNIVTDLVILVLPIPMILKLQMNRTKKFSLLGIFILGGCGLVTSIIRFAFFFTIDAFGDPTWASVPLLTVSCLEPGIYFICACLPGLQPMFRSMGGRLTRGSNKVSGTYQTKGFRRMGPEGQSGKDDAVISLESVSGDRQWLGRAI